MITTENIVLQEEQDPLGLLVDASAPQGQGTPCQFVHLLNVYAKDGRNALDQEQVHVLDSLREAAQNYAKHGGKVSFLAACEESDQILAPSDFAVRSCLKRRANALPEFRSLPPLPFLFDVLGAASAGSSESSEFVVYTNFDIAVQPFFFQFLDYFIRGGFDAVIVNRRTVCPISLRAPLFVGQSDIGQPHPGMDCFVFPRSWLGCFTPTAAITGVGQVMRSLLYNLVAKAQRLLFLSRTHVTLHYGDDRRWRAPEFELAEAHNAREAEQLWRDLSLAQAARFAELAIKLPWVLPKPPPPAKES